jgi:anti-anti-sigma factor
MEITHTNEILSVGGFAALTAANSDLIKQRICTALNGHTSIEIDLSQTTSVDCAGIGALVALRKFATVRNCVMRLVNLTPAVQQLFDFTRAGMLLDIVKTPSADYVEEKSYSVLAPATWSVTSLAVHASPAPVELPGAVAA